MKIFESVCAQGDVLIRRMDALPGDLTASPVKDGCVVVTHSETGHSHVMEIDRVDDPAVELFETDNPLIAWIKVNRPTPLKHLRNHDTHEPIMFGPGVYQVRRQREHTPEGFRRVED